MAWLALSHYLNQRWNLSIEPLRTNFSEILIKIRPFLFTKLHLKISSGKWRASCLAPNVWSANASPGPVLYMSRTGSWSIRIMLHFNVLSWQPWLTHTSTPVAGYLLLPRGNLRIYENLKMFLFRKHISYNFLWCSVNMRYMYVCQQNTPYEMKNIAWEHGWIMIIIEKYEKYNRNRHNQSCGSQHIYNMLSSGY